MIKGQRGEMAQAEESNEIDEVAARFAAMPTFPLALREYSVNLMRMRRSPRILNKLISHHARWRVAGYLMYLNADRERFGGDGGATYSNLMDMCRREPVINPRTMKTVLALLQLTGSLRAKRSRKDGRSKTYQPSERMNEFTRQWMGYGTKVLDILEPEKQRSRLLRNDPDFANRFLVSSGRAHRTAVPLVSRLANYIAFFGSRDGAGGVLLAVMLADIDGTPVASRNDLAKSFGFSKTQVTNVFSDGKAQGYFTLDEAGVPAPTPHLRDLFQKWVALELAFYAVHMPALPRERAPQPPLR